MVGPPSGSGAAQGGCRAVQNTRTRWLRNDPVWAVRTEGRCCRAEAARADGPVKASVRRSGCGCRRCRPGRSGAVPDSCERTERVCNLRDPLSGAFIEGAVCVAVAGYDEAQRSQWPPTVVSLAGASQFKRSPCLAAARWAASVALSAVAVACSGHPSASGPLVVHLPSVAAGIEIPVYPGAHVIPNPRGARPLAVQCPAESLPTDCSVVKITARQDVERVESWYKNALGQSGISVTGTGGDRGDDVWGLADSKEQDVYLNLVFQPEKTTTIVFLLAAYQVGLPCCEARKPASSASGVQSSGS